MPSSMGYLMKSYLWSNLLSLFLPAYTNLYTNFTRLYMVLNRDLGHGLKRLSMFLISLDFIGFKVDPSLFFRVRKSHYCYILIYVDDIVLTGSSNFEIQSLIYTLYNKFALKDLGKLNYFLGIEVSYSTSYNLFLS